MERLFSGKPSVIRHLRVSYASLLDPAVNVRNEVSFRLQEVMASTRSPSWLRTGSAHTSSSAVRSVNSSFLCASWHALDVDTAAAFLQDINCPDLQFEAAWSLTNIAPRVSFGNMVPCRSLSSRPR